MNASLSGFDTHSSRVEEHPILLKELTNGIAACIQAVVSQRCQGIKGIKGYVLKHAPLNCIL
jgi:hypothetical protein